MRRRLSAGPHPHLHHVRPSQYYPSTLNSTRCCAQPICTECFVQIKRADPTHTNPPSSQPAECPFCTAEPFGITYTPPPSATTKTAQSDEQAVHDGEASPTAATAASSSGHKRRKSLAHTDPDVLTTGKSMRACPPPALS